MGKTTDPLKMLVDIRLVGEHAPVFSELEGKGHTIRAVDLSEFDLILAPNASRLNEHLIPKLPELIKDVRKRRREEKKGKQ